MRSLQRDTIERAVTGHLTLEDSMTMLTELKAAVLSNYIGTAVYQREKLRMSNYCAGLVGYEIIDEKPRPKSEIIIARAF